MEPTTILDKIITGQVIEEQDEQIITLLKEYADGLTNITTERPKAKLIITLTFRFPKDKAKLIDVLKQKKEEPTQEKEKSKAKDKIVTNLDPQRLHILVPKEMSCWEAIEILKKYGEIDFYDFVEMDKRPPKIFAIYVRYCTQEAADQAKKSTAFLKEVRLGTKWILKDLYANLPREYKCLYCHHKVTLSRKECHDEVCLGQQLEQRRKQTS
ncbi:hypothetical protein TKK_0015508 [Trichogramma kaykai]|uniref:RRM domain-containing protein n=1 Tax=Trichogramma kaykai TaxID=54128 RepID=A0ABD2WB36_9HYME